MDDRDAAWWEELARREPYFPVHTPQGRAGVASSRTATAEFFATGEADLSSLLEAVTSTLQREIPLTSAMDFGCGAGRLTLALARRAGQVVAADLAPTMLEHARRNAESAGLHNIRYIPSAGLRELPQGSFDFVVSLLVLQYIPPADGYALVRTLTDLLTQKSGIAALHVTLQTAGAQLRRLARATQAGSRFAEQRLRRDRPRPAYAQVHRYDETILRRAIEAAGGHIVAGLPLEHGVPGGMLLIVEKGSVRS